MDFDHIHTNDVEPSLSVPVIEVLDTIFFIVYIQFIYIYIASYAIFDFLVW